MTPRLLVVDDEPDLRLLVELHLAPEYDIAAVATGEEALRRVEAEEFDAVLLDLRLPGIDGFEVLEELRRRPATHDTPIIMLTAHGTSEAEARCRQAGCNAFVLKPFTAAQLRRVVGDTLSSAA